MARHYLDHASTSTLRPPARDAMVAWLTGGDGHDLVAGDPSRIHVEGMRARAALEEARDQLAALVGARSREVVFTSGATEAIATAVWGAVRRAVELGHEPHVVLAAVEHSAVRQSSTAFAEAFGGSVSIVGVDRLGRIDVDEVAEAVRPDTALVHVQWGNHEVPTLQPVDAVVGLANERGVLVHVDAAQAAGRVPLDFGAVGADLLSLSGPKFGAPPGTGALLVRRGLRLTPLLTGGDQERARRAGLENLPALVGLGAAAEALLITDAEGETALTVEERSSRAHTDRLLAALARTDGIEVLGEPGATGRLPHLVCVSVDGVEPQGVLLGLDQAGIAAHSGSACASESLEPSPVLEAMGADAHRSLRISVGWDTTDADVDALLDTLPVVVERLRALA
ncbi:cysteine desulfurase family protein [Rhabdothermincola salaria]|uniref:cysteine desulfurase family protein n=1 Tax=Rhabdothermincola salaria TaxID=2903142 RepID=UPI001E472D62|nr:cysteine desulfurase [Rhabdothermincola salaria]